MPLCARTIATSVSTHAEAFTVARAHVLRCGTLSPKVRVNPNAVYCHASMRAICRVSRRHFVQLNAFRAGEIPIHLPLRECRTGKFANRTAALRRRDATNIFCDGARITFAAGVWARSPGTESAIRLHPELIISHGGLVKALSTRLASSAEETIASGTLAHG